MMNRRTRTLGILGPPNTMRRPLSTLLWLAAGAVVGHGQTANVVVLQSCEPTAFLTDFRCALARNKPAISARLRAGDDLRVALPDERSLVGGSRGGVR